MILAVLLVLIVFWFLGYSPFFSLHLPIFSIGRISINLWDILIFILVLYLIDLLPGSIRAIAVVLLILWLLGLFGIVAIPMFSNIIVIAIIIGLVLYLLSGI
jgi:hypothetical protein